MYLNFNVLNNEVFETGCDDILMSDWGDEGWKARKKRMELGSLKNLICSDRAN